MARLKTFAKYVLMIVGVYVLTMFLTYIGFNSSYHNIEKAVSMPEQVNVELSQATKVNGRIFGKIKNEEENDINGKYIKAQIFDRNNNLAGTKYIKIENANFSEEKKFAIYFTAENIKSYTIDIIEASEKTDEEAKKASELFKDVFTNEELKKGIIITTLLYCVLL